MNIRRFAPIVMIICTGLGVVSVRADVKTQERTQMRFEGALGRIVNMFSGRGAREGIVSTVAVKGDRMMTTTDATGEIVDLAEEKVYTLDMKKKTYQVVTFAEMRKKMEDAMADAKKQAAAQKDEKREGGQVEFEVDFSVRETGQSREIAGIGTKESLVTIAVREKGKTIEDGGMVMEASMWMAPSAPALKELQDFRVRYAQQLFGPMMAQAAPTMAQAMAMYPMMQDAMKKFQEEGSKLEGTPLLTTTKFQLAAPPQSAETSAQADEEKMPTSVGGLIGGFGRRMARRKADEKDASTDPPGRSTILTTTTETLQVASAASDSDVALPSGFKQR